MASEDTQRRWTFFTNHGHVLIHVASNPDARVREIAAAVGITERAAQGILRDLVEAGYLSVVREGRRNSYTLDRERRLRHPAEEDRTIGQVLSVFEDSEDAPA